MSWSSLSFAFMVITIYSAISIKAETMSDRMASCTDDSVLCHDGSQCVKKLDFCNDIHDCNDSSDERFCGKHICLSNAFPCMDGEQCVPREVICDQNHDCYDGSDEEVCEPSERCSLEHDRFLCRNGQQCLHIDRLCDNKSDCSDQSDEEHQCDKSITSCNKGFCHQVCIPTPSGPVCRCHQGFVLQNKTCDDIDECENHVCSQTCTNYPGTYNCSCQEGYQLHSNGTCSALGPDPVLYIATNNQILSLEIRSASKEVTPILQNLECINSLATDGRHLYWTDCKNKAVYMYNLEGHHRPEVVIDTGLGSPEGIAVDVTSSHLYIVDSSKNRIVVCNNYGDVCDVVLDNLKTPKDVVIVNKNRKLIWSEVGKKPSIMSSQMNGDNKSILVSDGIQLPHSLAVDEPMDRLYWIDSVLDRIESVYLDGTSRKIIFSRSVKHPFGIAVFEDLMYWGDQDHAAVMSADKNTGRHVLQIATDISHMTSIVINHPVLYRSNILSNSCSSQDCTDICLDSGAGHTCGCPYHKLLSTDKKSCIGYKEGCSNLLIGGNGAILRYPLCGIGKREDIVSNIIVNEMKKVSVIGQYKSTVVYRDESRGIIGQISMEDGSNPGETGLFSKLNYIGDACIDWNSGIIFWTLPLLGKVQAGSLNGSLVRTIITNRLQQPETITVDPEGGYIYYTDSGKHPKIWACYTDGSHCEGIRVKIAHINDIVFDHYLKRLIYSESGDNTIRSVNVEQPVNSDIIYSSPGERPIYLTFDSEFIYWTNQNKGIVEVLKKSDSQKMDPISLPQLSIPNGLILAPGSIDIHNACSKDNGGCMHFCFATAVNQSCSCQDGWSLNPDLKSCQEIKCSGGTCDKKEDSVTMVTEMTTSKTTASRTCPEFQCKDGHCIDNKYVCDHHPDCYDESDEENCDHRMVTSTPPIQHGRCDSRTHFSCDSGECIPYSQVCDKLESCTTGVDKHRMCEVACVDSGCSQGCYPSPKGPQCYCYHGYKLSDSNKSCLDIDECSIRNGNCSQICTNYPGGHVCTCIDGYVSSGNGSDCVAPGSRPSFVVASPMEGVYQLNEHFQKIDLNLANTSTDTVSLDIDMKTGNIYFSTEKGEIHIFSSKTKTSQLISKEFKFAVSLAYDWIGENLYISDDHQKQLLACKIESSSLRCKTLFFDVMLKSIVLYPEKGIMFAASFGQIRQIVKLCMNGQHQEVIVNTDMGWPAGLTIDKPANRLYWIDEEFGHIESSDLFGKDRYTVFKESHSYKFTALDVFDNYLYLADRKTASLLRMDKLGPTNPETIYKALSDFSDIKVVHSVLQQHDSDVCRALKCEQLCLLTVDLGADCACYNGYLLHNDSVHCKDMKTPESEILQSSPGLGVTKLPVFEITTKTTDINSTFAEKKHPSSCYLPCQHDGICVISNTEDKCVCISGYHGKLCENKEDNSFLTSSLVIGVGMVLLGLILAVTSIYFFKYKKDGYQLLPCRRKSDDVEGLVSEMSVRGPVINNTLFQQFDDINYPPECLDRDLKYSPSSQSVDSAFVSKIEDSDSQSSFGIEESGGRYGYTQI